MLFLERARFVHIGAPDCRIDDLTISALDERGRPVDTVIWLRNGGGKTVLLGLFFAHLLPGARDFLRGKKENARFSDHVLDGDTSYVAARWVGAPVQPSLSEDEFGDGRPRLVTGRAVERRTGFSGTVLPDLFFSFRPLAGILDLDTLPWAVEDTRLDLAGFRGEMERLSRAHPELELVVMERDLAWASHLRSQGLDPEIVRYQLQMNAGEGEAATGFMKFRTSDEFVDFVVSVVTPREALDTVEEEIRTYGAKLRRLPEFRCELELIERALPALGEHAANLEAKERLETSRRTLLNDAVALRGGLRAAHELAVAEAALAEEQLARLEDEARGVRQERLRLQGIVWEAAYWVALHREDAAREELRAASDRRVDAARLLEDWKLAEPLARRRWLEVRRRELRTLLTEHERETEPLRRAAERAGSVLRQRLLALAQAARREAGERRLRASDHTRRWRATWQEADRARADLEGLQARVAEARQQLHELSAEQERLHASGSLARDEAAAAAIDRWRAETSRIAERLTAIDRRLRTIRGERAQLQHQHVQLAGERARLDGDRQRGEERVAEIERDRRDIWENAVLAEVCELVQPDVWVERERLESALERRVLELSGSLVSTELGAAADRRSRAALEATGQLPPTLDVERALEILRAAGIVRAYPGWEYLRRAGAPAAADMLISAPELAGGILLNDPHDVDRALETLEESGIHPTSVVGLGLAEELLPSPGRAARLWRPHPALFDPVAAEAEQDRLAERLTAVDGELAGLRARLETVREFRARLVGFLDRWPAGTLGGLEEQVAALIRRVRELDVQVEGLATRGEAIDREASGLESERSALVASGQRVPSIVAELRVLAASEARAVEWRTTVAEGPARAQEAAERRAGKLRESEEHEKEAESAQRLAAGKDATAEQWEAQAVELPSSEEEEPGLAELSAEELRRVWETRDHVYREELGAEAIMATLGEVEGELGRLAAATRASEAQRERVLVLLAQPDGATEELRRDALRRAEQELTAVVSHEGGLGTALAQRSREREAAELERVQLEAGLIAPDLEAALRLHERYKYEERDAGSRENSLNGQRGQVAGRLARARDRAQGLQGALDTMAAAADLADAPEVEPYGQDVEQARADVRRIVVGLKRIAGDGEQARSAAAGSGRRLQVLAEAREYLRLGPKLTSRIGEPGSLASHVTALAGELDLRRRPLHADIESAEMDRKMVVGGLVKAVRDAFRDLRRISEASRLPDDLGAWGGESFVRINFETPRAEDEWELRVGAVVEDWVNREQVPPRSGLAILRQALRGANTRRTGGGDADFGGTLSVFHVTLLKPDAILTKQRYSVETMKFSEGQDLTTAILLYCAFVNQRVLRQGDPGGVTGMLLLDNPIGKASLEQLIRLQRTVAMVMGVQLIATTGVRDREAISHYPKVVGIRPVRSRDARLKYLVANGDPMGDGLAAAELIARDSR